MSRFGNLHLGEDSPIDNLHRCPASPCEPARTRVTILNRGQRLGVALVALVVLALNASAGTARGQAAGGADELDNPFPRRIAVPDLTGGVGWINTARPISIKDLRGKFVLLDFWTYCCINCMHILPELKKLEEAYPNNLVVIGVHSAKFETEEDTQNITDAVLRYEIKHPVVNDAKRAIWDRYGMQSWPSLLLIDPEGKAFFYNGGEIKAEQIEEMLKVGIPYYRKKGLLDENPIHFELAAAKATDTPLRYPGKVLADAASRRLFIADSNHNRIVVTDLDGKLIATIGSGKTGKDDGVFASATFHHPQGMALAGETLYVADTENHMLRKVDLTGGTVKTIAGTGRQALGWPGLDVAAYNAGIAQLPDRWAGPPLTTELNSPWDLLIHDGALYIAMAGPHQIWRMPLDESEIAIYAGNGREDIADGPLLPKQPFQQNFASFAQPSGLATDGKQLFVADSEGSSIRAVPFDPRRPARTIVGTVDLPIEKRLFTFGDKDGAGKHVLLQHPLGVAYAGSTVYVADTYNNKIKALDPAKKTVKTIAGTGKPGHEDDNATFDEPAGLSAAGGKLYIADTNNHAIRTIDLKDGNKVGTLEIAGLTPPGAAVTASATGGAAAGSSATGTAGAAAPSTANRGIEVPVEAVALKPQDGFVWLSVKLTLPAGYKINPEAPMRYTVAAAGAAGPVDRSAIGRAVKVDPPAAEFQVEVPIAGGDGDDKVAVSADFYYCQDGPAGICKAERVTWNIPLRVIATADKSTAPLTFAAP